MRVAIISKPEKPELHSIIPELLTWLAARKVHVIADPVTIGYAADGAKSIAHVAQRESIAAANPEFVLVLGGDGTLLAAARAVSKADIPILAVNLGSLGFLTEVRLEHLYEALTEWMAGALAPEDRTMVHCRLMRDGRSIAEYDALNDVVIAKGAIARVADIRISVNDSFVAEYKADGVIVATPTGSTAYSLAAGGPVLAPTVRALVITPISPHALTNRPLVVPDDAEILIEPLHVPEQAFLTVDGQEAMPMNTNDQVRCSLSRARVRLIRKNDPGFFHVLREKLKWGER